MGGSRGCAPPFRPKVPFFVEECNIQTKIFTRKGTRSLHKTKIFPRKGTRLLQKKNNIFPRKGTSRSLHKTKNFPQKKPQACFFCNYERRGILFPDARKTHVSTWILKFFWGRLRVMFALFQRLHLPFQKSWIRPWKAPKSSSGNNITYLFSLCLALNWHSQSVWFSNEMVSVKLSYLGWTFCDPMMRSVTCKSLKQMNWLDDSGNLFWKLARLIADYQPRVKAVFFHEIGESPFEQK
jgi:hypothetical protein